jgi:hypothetical protein
VSINTCNTYRRERLSAFRKPLKGISLDQIKPNAQFANDVCNENMENQAQYSHGANEVRTLSDLELVIAGGGDGIVVW